MRSLEYTAAVRAAYVEPALPVATPGISGWVCGWDRSGPYPTRLRGTDMSGRYGRHSREGMRPWTRIQAARDICSVCACVHVWNGSNIVERTSGHYRTHRRYTVPSLSTAQTLRNTTTSVPRPPEKTHQILIRVFIFDVFFVFFCFRNIT